MASEKVERPEWMPPPITLTIIDGRSSYVFEDATKPAPPIITSNVSSTNPAPPIITSDASSATTAARLATYAKDFVFRPSACGLTAFAVRDIKCGERLVAEEPLVWWTIRPEETVTTAGIDALVNALDPTDREDYYSLCQNAMHGSEKTAYGIWLSNAYPTDSPMEAAQNKLAGVVENAKTGAVYAVCCRFNHSCTPNGHCAWNPRIDRQTIHALRDITRGEQITVCYLPELGMARCERQQRLLDDFGFDCACDACKLQGEALVQSDKRRTRIGQLSNKLSRAVNGDMVAGGPQNFNRKRTKAVELCNERIELMEIEGVGGTCWDTLYAACSYCRSVGDKQLASSFASKAAESARHALGKDSQEYQKYASYIGTRKADAGKKKKP